MSGPAIVVRDLHKRYGDLEAVRGIDLTVNAGEVFALLGPNGAGKTTTVEILEGHRSRTSGDVSVLGFDPASGGRALKERIGIVLQEAGVDPYLTVGEVLEMYHGYYRRPRATDEVLELVGLEDERDRRVIRLSGGRRRRLDVAVGLVGNPDVLFLDEPTTGFDPAARRAAWEMLARLRDLGTTIFLTTHYMEEAQRLADRAAIIVSGEIVASGAPHQLRATDRTTRITYRGAPPPFAQAAAAADGLVEIRTEDPIRLLHELTAWAIATDEPLEHLEVRSASLEDVYLELTGGSER